MLQMDENEIFHIKDFTYLTLLFFTLRPTIYVTFNSYIIVFVII